ncbi:hypothetical protein HY374_01155 [Candidatus Berkelbacteria bacterium]|nr:hypothetical protein [Candidatus Berkelbacteria bacterium]
MSKEYFEKIVDLVTAAFGLVAALAWNEAIQQLIQTFYPSEDDLAGKFIYAVFITLIAVFITTRLARIHDKLKR